MPKGLYELSAGFSDDSLLNLKIDTFERMNRLQSNFDVPDYKPISIPTYLIPKDIDSDTLLQKKDERLPTFKDALFSTDKRVAEAAKNLLLSEATKNPVYRGIGVNQYVPYTEGQEKFTNKSFFKGKRNTMYGYNPYISMAENEQFMHENVWDSYTNMGKAWRGVGLFTGRALSKAVTGLVGMVGDLGAMAWNGLQELGDLANINDGTKNNFWYDVSNNWLARKMEEADQHVKDQWLPTYKALDYDQKGAWQKLFDPYTWTNSFADGAGFLLQFVVPGTIFGKIGQTGKLARGIGTLQKELQAAEAVGDVAKATRLAKTIEEVKNVSGFTKAMGYDFTGKSGKVAEFFTGSENMGGISAHVFNTMLESVAETKEGFNSTVRELMDKGWSKEKAIEEAGQNAPNQFLINLGILTASNALTNKFLQKALNNRAINRGTFLNSNTLPKDISPAKTQLGQFFKSNPWGNKISFYGGNAFKSSVMEGFWEENAQTAAARWARGEYERQGNDGGGHEKVDKSLSGFLKQLGKQTVDAVKGNDREAADSIMAGAVIGVLGNTVFSKLAGTRGEGTFLPEGERKMRIRERAQKVSNFINTKDAWLSLNTFNSDLYKEDGTLDDDKVKEKTEDIKEKLSKLNSVFAKQLTSEDLLDAKHREKLENEVFVSYVKAHILNETGDALVSKLKNWKDKTEDELSLYGVSKQFKDNAEYYINTAENLVKNYEKVKGYRYAAPSDTSFEEYTNNTNAIHSVIFDYSARRDMNQHLSDKYQEMMKEDNPFSEFSLLQEYNEKQLKLEKLQQKLINEDLDVITREKIQDEIKKLEKEQKERKETISSSGDTKEDKSGLIFPKDSDKKKESDKIAENQGYFSLLNEKIDLDVQNLTLGELIDEYSKEETGYQKYLDTIEFWNNVNNKEADEKIEEEEKEEAKNTVKDLEVKIEDLKEKVGEAETQEEREKILEEVEALEKEKEDLKEEKDITEKDEEDVDDIPPPPKEIQYGVDDYAMNDLAYETPFKTYGRQTFDPKDDKGDKIWWKEVALSHGYDHDLNVFLRQYQIDSSKYQNKYETFIIKDTLEFLKERLSEEQLKEYDEGKFQLGAIVVFREKGQTKWLRFPNGKIIASSYNNNSTEEKPSAFDYNYEDRVFIHSERKGKTIPEVLEFFKEQQNILEAIRERVILEDVQIRVKVISGRMGLYPTTTAENALERFESFYDVKETLTLIKPENKNLVPGSSLGQTYLNIPAVKTYNGKNTHIPVFFDFIKMGVFDPNNLTLQNKIYQSIQAIQYNTFKTKQEASDVIRSYLFNFFYITDNQFFKINPVKGGYKIDFATKDKDGVITEEKNWLGKIRLKLLDKLYNTEEGLSLFEKIDNVFQPTEQISKEQYQEFVHNHLLTKRKLVVQNKKNAGEKIFNEPVNAYLNLSNDLSENDVVLGDAVQTSEEAVVSSFNDLMDDLNPEIEKLEKDINTLEEEKKEIEKELEDIEEKKRIEETEKRLKEAEKKSLEELIVDFEVQIGDLKRTTSGIEPGIVIFHSGLAIPSETESNENPSKEDAEEIVEQNVETLIEEVVDDMVDNEDEKAIAEEEGISEKEVKATVSKHIKNVFKGIKLPKLGKKLSSVIKRILAWITGLTLSFMIFKSTPVYNSVLNKVTDIVYSYAPKDTIQFNTAQYSVTPFDGCAAWTHNQVKSTVGVKGLQKLNLYGDAWTSTSNMVNKGSGTYVYNVFSSQKPELNSKDSITSYIKEQISKSKKLTVSDFQQGDIVNLFYEGSSFTVQAYKDGRDVYTSHVGIVKINNDGEIVLEHNIHGVIHTNLLQDVIDGKIRSTGGKMLVSAIARPDYKNIGFIVDNNKPQKNNIPNNAEIATLLSLLAVIRKKRENGEAITEEDLESLKNRLKEIDVEITNIKNRILNLSNDLSENEQLFLKEIENKEFVILKPYTDVLKNASSSVQNKKDALKEISDQLLSPATAERVGTELGKRLSEIIDNLGYEAPKENEALKEITKEPESNVVVNTKEDELKALKEKQEQLKDSNNSHLMSAISNKIAILEKEIEKEKPDTVNEEDNLSPLDKLRQVANEDNPISVPKTIISYTFEGKSFKIDFENNTIEGVLKDIDKSYTEEFFNSFTEKLFEKAKIDTDLRTFYLVKQKEMGKFVIFDENLNFLKVSELPLEVRENSIFKDMENCN